MSSRQGRLYGPCDRSQFAKAKSTGKTAGNRTYPVGGLVPAALGVVGAGGTVVCAGIHMSDIPSFPYDILWEERVLRSVANLTRADAREFLALAPKVPVKTRVVPMKLSQANEALERLRKGELTGAAVLIP